MNKTILYILIAFVTFSVNAQACDEMIDLVKSKSYGTTYNSYDSEAISNVKFYGVTIDYQYYYFAIVCFKDKYSYGCNEYLYQVSSDTEINYSLSYLDSAGKAFWKYIQPYNNNLSCAPNFE